MFKLSNEHMSKQELGEMIDEHKATLALVRVLSSITRRKTLAKVNHELSELQVDMERELHVMQEIYLNWKQ